MARREATPTGKIRVAEKGKNDDGSDWIIEIRSFVQLAQEYEWGGLTEEFKRLGLQPQATPFRRKKQPSPTLRASASFAASLQKVLSVLAKKAKEKNVNFDPQSMEGTKKEFWDFVCKSCAAVDVSFPTFDTYIHGICRFKPGARARGYYLTLFDGDYPTIE